MNYFFTQLLALAFVMFNSVSLQNMQWYQSYGVLVLLPTIKSTSKFFAR
jgi:hypothetical protein